MKTIAILCLLFAGCASTTFYDRKTGKPIARFQGDMDGSEYRDGSTSWKVQHVSHSSATLAQGQASGKVIGEVSKLAGGIGAAVATSGALK